MTSEGNHGPTFWDERCMRFGHTGWSDELVYNYDQPLRLKAIRKAISRFRLVGDGDTALDIGCGTGDFIQLLSEAGARVTGLDVSQEAVRIARQRFQGNDRVEVITGKVEELDFPPESYDLVTSITVLQHIVDDRLFDRAVQNVTEVVKTGGNIILLETAPSKAPTGPDSHYVRARTRQEWIDAFAAKGCQLVNETSHQQWGIVLSEKVARLMHKLLGRQPSGCNDPQPLSPPRNSRSRRILSLLRSLETRLVFAATYPLDYWLSVPVPSSIAEHKILLFKKDDMLRH